MAMPRSAARVNGAAAGVHTQRTYSNIDDLPLRRPVPHNMEAEQALLGAILVDNEAHDRVYSFLEPAHFFDPLHQQIYETAAKLIGAGKQATPITLKTFFENAEPIGNGLSVPAYLGQLAVNATTLINVRDYGETIRDLWSRRQAIIIGEDLLDAAYDSPVDVAPAAQIEAFQERLASLRTAASGGGEPDHASQATWPVLDERAMHGVAGELACIATARSEADPVAVLATMLTWSGAAFGRSRYVWVGDTQHHPHLSMAAVGASARARKGTSEAPVRAVMAEVNRVLEDGMPLRVQGGLSTGEGLIAAVSDHMVVKDAEGKEEVAERQDKRLLVLESELGRVLRATSRHGSSLSMVMREAWDGVPLGIMTKTSPMTATDAHIAVLGHITRAELAELLETSDIWNGFTNRILWLCVRRRAILPFPEGTPEADRRRIAERVAAALCHAKEMAEAQPAISFTKDARDLWRGVYPRLTADLHGVLGVVTARAEAQVLRLALTYALLDQADEIWTDHLEAALAFHQYAVDSARFIFATAGEVPRDPVAERIVSALETGAKTQTELRDLFNRNLGVGELAAALQGLQERGQITPRTEGTGGRPRLIWSLCQTTKTT